MASDSLHVTHICGLTVMVIFVECLSLAGFVSYFRQLRIYYPGSAYRILAIGR